MRNPELVIEFIEEYCYAPGAGRKKMKLLPFQKEFIRASHAPGVRQAYLSIARKNGKTALIAAILLAHLVGPEAVDGAQIVSGAMSEEQAAIIFTYADRIIKLNPDLQAVTSVRYAPKMIVGSDSGAYYKPISSKAKTAQGLAPRLAILDEIGQIEGESDPFFTAVDLAMGTDPESLLIAISTQASTDQALFSQLIDDGLSRQDPAIIAQLHTTHPKAELDDEGAWAHSNPGMGHFRDLEDLRKNARKALRIPSQESDFRNYCLNQRVQRLSPFVSQSTWEACGGVLPDVDEATLTWVGGLDLSATTDLSAYVRVAWTEDGGKPLLLTRSHFWLPAEGIDAAEHRDKQPYRRWHEEGHLFLSPGNTIDYRHIARHVLRDIRANRLDLCGFDSWGMGQFHKSLYDEKATEDEVDLFVKHGQGFKDMAPALNRLEGFLLDHQLRHGDHPILTMCAQNAVVQRDSSDNRKLTKAIETRRIDGLIALTMACTMTAEPPRKKAPKKSIYEDPGIVEEYRNFVART